MKKVLLSIIFTFFIVFPVFSEETKWQQYENQVKYERIKDIDEIQKVDVDSIIKQDYNGYYNGMETSYGDIMSRIEEWSKSSKKEKYINLKYLDMIRENIKNYVENNVPLEYISVSDDDINVLSDGVKKNVAMYNLVFVSNTAKLNNSQKPLKKDYSQILSKINEKAFATSSFGIKNCCIERNDISYCGEAALKRYNDTEKQINDLYYIYKKHPTNMENNNKLATVLLEAKGIYENDINIIQNTISRAYDLYKSSYEEQKKREKILDKDISKNKIVEPFYSKDEYMEKISNSEPPFLILEYYNKIKDTAVKYDTMAYEVFKYSYKYEEKLYQASKQGGRIALGSLSDFVYISRTQPKNKGFYQFIPQTDFPLYVKQSVPGGVILTGSYEIHGASKVNDIFLETSKQFADGARIVEPIYAEYRGFYDYITVLGASRRIYKFYRYGTNELKNTSNNSSQKFYFYGQE